jgi:hypothetical protein
MMDGIDIMLVLRNNHLSYQLECPLLETLVPDPRQHPALFPRRWDCGPNTFDFLLDFILEPNVADPEERERHIAKVRDGKWELVYRNVPIQRGAQTPEDKLWPA